MHQRHLDSRSSSSRLLRRLFAVRDRNHCPFRQGGIALKHYDTVLYSTKNHHANIFAGIVFKSRSINTVEDGAKGGDAVFEAIHRLKGEVELQAEAAMIGFFDGHLKK